MVIILKQVEYTDIILEKQISPVRNRFIPACI